MTIAWRGAMVGMAAWMLPLASVALASHPWPGDAAAAYLLAQSLPAEPTAPLSQVDLPELVSQPMVGDQDPAKVRRRQIIRPRQLVSLLVSTSEYQMQ